jgi:hypothetical protein
MFADIVVVVVCIGFQKNKTLEKLNLEHNRLGSTGADNCGSSISDMLEVQRLFP